MNSKDFEAAPRKNKNQTRILMWLSVLITLVVYSSTINNQFVNWDDTNYIQFNPHIRQLDFSSIRWMLTSFYAGYWIPLCWLSYAVDFAIGRLEPWIYHLDNLVLHCLNTALVFLLSLKFLSRSLKKDGETPEWVPYSALGCALLFGIHPLHVESVAWAAERKDLLCGLFFLLSLYCYLEYAVRQGQRVFYYGICLLFFVLALLAKPMAISLPFLFILFDDWPLERLSSKTVKVYLEKIPFLVGAIAVAWITVLSQFQAGAGWGLNQAPLTFRLLNACHSIVFYLVKMFFPVHLAAFYPVLLENTFSPGYLLSAVGVIAITLSCFLYRKRAPFFMATWFFYLVTLAPVLGILQVGNQAAADRFTYLPLLGLFLLATAFVVKRLWKRPPILILLGAIVAVLLGAGTFLQIAVWKNPIALWENVLKFYPKNNLIVHQNLGKAYEDAGRPEEALAKYNDAIHPSFNFLYPHWGKGRVLGRLGRLEEAIQEYQIALSMNPLFPPLHDGLGMVYEHQGKWDLALKEISDAIVMDPRYADAYNDLGELYKEKNSRDKVIEAFQKARYLDPDNPTYFKNLARAYLDAGRPREAMGLYRELSSHPRSLLSLGYNLCYEAVRQAL